MTESAANIPSQAPPVAILSHGTAMSYYRTLDPTHPKAAHVTKAYPLQKASASSDLLNTFNPAYKGFGGAPLDLLVPNRSLVRTSSKLIAHSCEIELPSNSFWKLNDTLYVSSPELCFMQMAQSMSIAQLVELGVNLCSSYFVDVKTGKLPKRKPVTTPLKLARYVEKLTGAKGAKKAREALKWVVPGSRSPMETKVFVLLCYPKSRGGYGFVLAVLNHDVDPGRSEHLTEQDYFIIDICWPEHFTGVEYYGGDDHDDSIVHDRRRLDALEALGWNMVVIDKQRLYNPDAFDVAANQLASHLNYRIRKDATWQEAHTSLRQDLGLLTPTTSAN